MTSESHATNLPAPGRVISKALALFLLLNILFAWLIPLPSLGRISIYNHLVPGRVRLPYADDPARSYNLSLFDLEAMFASHEIEAQPKPEDEYRVILIGDSSTWATGRSAAAAASYNQVRTLTGTLTAV